MPGFSLLCCTGPRGLAPRQAAVDAALNAACHHANYVRETLVASPSMLLASTGYLEYPMQTWETGGVTIIVEGRVYNKTAELLRSQLSVLAEGLFGPTDDAGEECRRWLLSADGDFVLVFVEKESGAIVLLNDVMGRLPCYYYEGAGEAILSREIGFIADLVPSKRYDRYGIAECLLFGYPLRDRTLVEGIRRIAPASFVKVDPQTTRVSVRTLHVHDFGQKCHAGRTVAENAEALVPLFREACVRRVSGSGENVLSLSGGLDSRAVAAGLAAGGGSFRTVTYQCGPWGAAEVPVARELARLLNVPWKLEAIGLPTGGDVSKLLNMKRGLNYLAMAYILSYLARVQEELGSGIKYFTGDGGDKALPALGPPTGVRTVDSVVEFLFRCKVNMPLAEVAQLTGLPQDDLFDDVVSCLRSYPEENVAHKYVHFSIYERAGKWLFEGEDRNRTYYWSTNPFYATEFFACAMGCPDAQKARNRLYLALLSRLHPAICAVKDANLGAPLNSTRHRLKRWILSELSERPWLLNMVKRRVLTSHSYCYGPDAPIVVCMRRQLAGCSRISEYLNRSSLEAILERRQECRRGRVDNLFTITSVIERLDSGSSTLEQMRDAIFG